MNAPAALSPAEFLPQILDRRARASDDGWFYAFLNSQGEETCRWRAADLARRARAVAARLERSTAPGEPVLLVFQPGADFLAAFMGCLWSGRLATPINPPRRNRLISRLVGVALDSGARVALTTHGLNDLVQNWLHESGELAALDWVAIDDLADDEVLPPATLAADDIAFIQYTSGSTAQPKGVLVSHGNLIEDLARMARVWDIGADSCMVSWLPAFHDLGLIFGLLQPLFSGGGCVQMAPNAFLQRPLLWLSAMTRYRATHSAAPSFAYDLCCRRIAEQDRAGLELGSLRMTMNAAEPINPEVMLRFSRTFAPCGFRHEAFAPAYGLAESTLALSANAVGEAPVLRPFDADALGEDRVVLLEEGDRLLPGSGRALPGIDIAIVDPETRRRCAPARVGEIWVSGPIIARGYWRRDEETRQTFGARIEGEADAGPYLRTGDLGAVMDGEIFVTGRLKDLIILGGTNYYPHDIERVAQNAHEALRPDNGAAFALVDDESGRENVVLVQELERTWRNADPAPLFQAITQAVWQELELSLSRVVLVMPGSVLRTSSGKIQRRANRQAYVDGELPVIAEWRAPRPRRAAEAEAVKAAPAITREEALNWLIHWLARRLALPASSLRADQGFADLGLDSADAVELSLALEEWSGRTLGETVTYDYPTLARLAAHLAKTQAPMAARGPANAERDRAGTGTNSPETGTNSPQAATSIAAAGTNSSAAGQDLEELLAEIERGKA